MNINFTRPGIPAERPCIYIFSCRAYTAKLQRAEEYNMFDILILKTISFAGYSRDTTFMNILLDRTIPWIYRRAASARAITQRCILQVKARNIQSRDKKGLCRAGREKKNRNTNKGWSFFVWNYVVIPVAAGRIDYKSSTRSLCSIIFSVFRLGGARAAAFRIRAKKEDTVFRVSLA